MAENYLVYSAIGRSLSWSIRCILFLHRSSSVVERPSSTTDWQPHRGFSVPRPDICSRSVYLTLTQRSEPKNPRFQTHFLTLNPATIVAPSASAISAGQPDGLKSDETDLYLNHTEQIMGTGAVAGIIATTVGGKDAGVITGALGAWLGEHGSCPDHKSLKIEHRRYSGNIPTEIDPRGSKQSFSCVD
mgnify:CR=1 FL=1